MKKLPIVIFLALATRVSAQCVVNGSNLIPNPSFESTTAFCNGTDNQVYVDQSPLTSWLGTDPLSSGASTPDIRKINTDVSSCGSITNAANSTCFTGNKRAGIFVKASFANGREYIQTPLTTSLVAGRTYCLSADLRTQYGAAGNRLLDTDGFGAHFRNGGAINIQTMNGGNQFIGPGSTLNLTPQVQQNAGAIITNACFTFSKTFVAAGGENRVILGNFRDDANTSTAGSSSTSYLLIDNLQLYEVAVSLPIELTSYEITCSYQSAVLNWSTLTERDNDYFTIERSCDGFNYEDLVQIKGAGNSSLAKNYDYTDGSPCNGYSYYRLSQTDFNGEKTVLNTLSSKCSEDEILLYPNPSSTDFTLKNFGSKISDVLLYDASGKLLENYQDKIIKMNEDYRIDAASLSAGVYLLQFTKNDSEISFIKLIKL